jgi:hypothetical protein
MKCLMRQSRCSNIRCSLCCCSTFHCSRFKQQQSVEQRSVELPSIEPGTANPSKAKTAESFRLERFFVKDDCGYYSIAIIPGNSCPDLPWLCFLLADFLFGGVDLFYETNVE